MREEMKKATIDEEKMRAKEKAYHEQRDKTVYISGAITDEPRYKANFGRAKKFLKSLGYRVFNPTSMPSGMEYQSYLKIAKAIIEEVDVVYMLRGWERSEGAKVEYNHAIDHAKTIFFELPLEEEQR